MFYYPYQLHIAVIVNLAEPVRWIEANNVLQAVYCFLPIIVGRSVGAEQIE